MPVAGRHAPDALRLRRSQGGSCEPIPTKLLKRKAPKRLLTKEYGTTGSALINRQTSSQSDPNQTLRSPKGLPLALPGARQRRPARVPRA